MKKKRKGRKQRKRCRDSKCKRKMLKKDRNIESCFFKLYKYAAKLKKARNIQNQFKRVNSSRAIITKKKGKKDDFSGTLDILVSALGGDKSAPKCSQSRAFNGDFFVRMIQER